MAKSQSTNRRFNLADGMIVVSASAATFTLVRATLPVIKDLQRHHYILTHFASMRRKYVLNNVNMFRSDDIKLIFLVEMTLLTWLFAIASMRLRRPRPSLRVTSFQPGIVAFGAAALASILGALSGFAGRTVGEVATLAITSLAVPLSWCALKLTRHWHPEACWIDRSGRTLGYCWWAVTWANVLFLIFLTIMWDTPGLAYPNAKQNGRTVPTQSFSLPRMFAENWRRLVREHPHQCPAIFIDSDPLIPKTLLVCVRRRIERVRTSAATRLRQFKNPHVCI